MGLEAAIEAWRGGAGNYVAGAVPGLGARHPVSLIRDALAACPDEAPSPQTTSLAFIRDDDLRESIRLDISAADRDLANGEWKGATVLAGSAVETLLLWVLQDRETQGPRTLTSAISTLRGNGTLARQPDPSPEHWALHEYVEVAELGLYAGVYRDAALKFLNRDFG